MSINSSTTSILTSVPTLSANNWYDFAKGMKMFFLGAGIDGIASGTPPSDPTELAKWRKSDRQIITYIYAKVDPDYHYLIQDLESGLDAWKALKGHFEKSTMGHRMQARQQFYTVAHDPSKPIAFYIQAITAASRKLTALGINLEETEIKDVLLMNLDSSYHPIRTTILAQKTEPTLDEVKQLLNSSTSAELSSSIAFDKVMVSQAGRKFGGNGHNHGYGSGSGSGSWRDGHRHGQDHHGSKDQHSGSGSPVDDKGFRWCNPTNEGACHRCGRTGHIAARCMYNMPQEVKDWIMAGSSQNSHPAQELANTTHHFLSSPIPSPCNSIPSSPVFEGKTWPSNIGPLLL